MFTSIQEKEEVNPNQDVKVQKDEEKLDNDETNKENEEIVNPTVEEIIKDNNVNVKENEEINKVKHGNYVEVKKDLAYYLLTFFMFF